MTGSVQLRRYLALRQTLERDEAAEAAGLSIVEAKLTDAAIAKGELHGIEPIPAAGVAANREETAMAEEFALATEPETDEPETELEIDDPVVELAADTLRGDVRDSLLDWIKANPKPWSQMGEADQRALAGAANRYAGTLVREVCKLVAANERPCIVATLTEYKEKDGVEAKLKLPSRGEVVAQLHEACGREVLIVTSGAEEYMGEAEIDSDQPALGIGEEYQEAAE